MKIRTYYKIDETAGRPRQSLEVPTPDVKAQLVELKAELEKAKDEARRKEIVRHIARLERFERVNLSSTGDAGEFVGKILKGKDSDTYLNSDLLSLREKGLDIAKLVLVYSENPEKDIVGTEIKTGDLFTVNFGANPSLRDRTGAGDIFSPNIKKLKINGVECERRNKPRPGFYSDTSKPAYRAIYDGYTIEILGTGDSTEEDTKALALQWKKERIRDTLLNGGGALTDSSEDTQIAEVAKKFQGQNIALLAYNPDLKTNGFSIETDEFKKFASAEGLSPSDTEEVHRVMTSIFRHESGGNYGIEGPELAEGSHKGTRAIGRYQIMPKNWRAWSWEIFSEVVDPTPENQDKIAFYQMMKNYLRHSAVNSSPEYYVREMALDWYGRGVISATTNSNFNTNAPGTKQYADTIYANYKRYS